MQILQRGLLPPIPTQDVKEPTTYVCQDKVFGQTWHWVIPGAAIVIYIPRS